MSQYEDAKNRYEDTVNDLLRLRQVRLVMPLIGPLLDAWDSLPNDFKDDLTGDFPEFARCLDEIGRVMEQE